MQTLTAKQWMELGNSYGRIEGRIAGPEEVGTLKEGKQSQLNWTLGALRD